MEPAAFGTEVFAQLGLGERVELGAGKGEACEVGVYGWRGGGVEEEVVFLEPEGEPGVHLGGGCGGGREGGEEIFCREGRWWGVDFVGIVKWGMRRRCGGGWVYLGVGWLWFLDGKCPRAESCSWWSFGERLGGRWIER
jgi:hypothetical protein